MVFPPHEPTPEEVIGEEIDLEEIFEEGEAEGEEA